MDIEPEENICPNCGEQNQYNLIIENKYGKVDKLFCTTCKTQTIFN